MKKRNSIFILIFLLCTSLFAQSGQMIVDLDSDIYNEIDMIYSLGNQLHPSSSRPWTLSELDYYLGNIKTENMGKAERNLYNKILKDRRALDTSYQIDDYTRVSTDLTLSSQAYAHTNTDYALSDDTTLDSNYYEWSEGGLDDRDSIIKFDGSVSYKDNFYWFMSLEYGNSKFYPLLDGDTINDNYYYKITEDTIDSNNGFSLLTHDGTSIYIPSYDPYYSSYFSNNIFDSNRDLKAMGPYRNYLSLGNGPLSFSFARTELSFGESMVGNFLLDESQHYYDYTNLSYYSDKFKVSWLNVFFDTQYTNGQEEETLDGFKIFMLTKFEMPITDSLSFSFSDGMMYEADTLNFANLNPTYFFHNLNNSSIFNSIANFEFSYQMDRGRSLYFQFVVDQLKLVTESDDSEPSAVGLIIGGKQIFDFEDYLVDLKMEAGFTSPQLYKREGVDFLVYNRYYTNSSEGNLTYVHDLNYMGFPYGGDCIFAQIESNYYSLKNYGFSATYFLLLQGPSTILSDYDAATSVFPDDIDSMRNTLSFDGNYTIETKIPVTLSGSLSFVDDYEFDTSENAFDIELVVGASITL